LVLSPVRGFAILADAAGALSPRRSRGFAPA